MRALAAPGVAPEFHLLAGRNPAVFLPRGSMLFDIDDGLLEALAMREPSALAELGAFAVAPAPTPPSVTPIAALSLNVAQACNLACSYCYADAGKFGGAPRRMEKDTAFAAIDRLVEQGRDRVTIGFIGGEPFLNRGLIHDCVAYAKKAAAQAGLGVGFSVTTNATLLTDADLQLLRDEGFTVTVSLDGGPRQNRHRTDRRGGGTTWRSVERIGPLLANPGRARVSARATITRGDLDVAGRIAWLSAAGFAEIGVSPARTGPDKALLLVAEDWPVLLARMIEAADDEFARVFSGRATRFGNVWSALRAIHRGEARSLPCGSAATYLSVDVDGAFASCHRTVGDEAFRMGSVGEGFSASRRAEFLGARAVDRQAPCSTCWARYLCGGGCHAEVTAMGRSGCDFIRGWLDFALRAYRDVANRRPELLGGGEI